MRALAADTPLHIEAETIAILRGMTPAQKAAMLTQMAAMSDQLTLTGIRMQHPQATPATLAHHLALRRIPHERPAHARGLLTQLPPMTYAANPVAIAVRVGAILERLGIRYYVGGSFASSIYGEYRTTSTLCSSTLAPSTASVIFERPDGTLGQAGGGSGRIGTRRRFPSSLPACRRAGAAAR